MLVAISTYGFAHFHQLIITQQNGVAGTISNSLDFISVQSQLMNAPLSYGHNINAHNYKQTDRCGILFNFNIIYCIN